MTRPRLLAAACTAVLVVALAGCGGGDGADASGSGGAGAEETTLRVFAAASLTESFETLRDTFEEQHPGVTVELELGPSSGLSEQIAGGAPADVFASASTTTMQSLVDDDRVGEPTDFATNSLEIAVPPDNPGDVQRLADLADPGVTVAVCAPDVPCGVVATEVLDGAGLDVQPVTEEVDVKSVLTKVTLGEVDAGLVYVTDVRAAGDAVTGVEVPDDANAVTDYPIAVVADSPQADLAQDWVDLVLSEEGSRVLQEAGFGSPS